MKGYRTILVAAVIGALGGMETADWVDVVGEEYDGLVLIVIAALIGGLRAITNTPVGQK